MNALTVGAFVPSRKIRVLHGQVLCSARVDVFAASSKTAFATIHRVIVCIMIWKVTDLKPKQQRIGCEQHHGYTHLRM